MNKIAYLFLLLSVMFLQSCGSRQVYDALQHSQKQRCQNLPPSEYSECMERASQSYDNYRRERDEAIRAN